MHICYHYMLLLARFSLKIQFFTVILPSMKCWCFSVWLLGIDYKVIFDGASTAFVVCRPT